MALPEALRWEMCEGMGMRWLAPRVKALSLSAWASARCGVVEASTVWM